MAVPQLLWACLFVIRFSTDGSTINFFKLRQIYLILIIYQNAYS